LGSPRPLRPRRFSRDLRFPPVVVPRSLAQTGSSPRELHSSSESSASHPPSPFPAPAPSLGLRSLFATSPAGVRAAGNPTSHRVSVLGVSHAPDGLLRQSAHGFISPHSHVQGSLTRNIPRAQPIRLVGVSCPLVVRRHRAASVARSSTRRRPVLRALDPCESPWLRRRGLAVAVARIPRGFSSSRCSVSTSR
jgi:hypothetical protein